MLEPSRCAQLTDLVLPSIRLVVASSGFNSVRAVAEYQNILDDLGLEERAFCLGLMYGFNEGREAAEDYNGPG